MITPSSSVPPANGDERTPLLRTTSGGSRPSLDEAAAGQSWSSDAGLDYSSRRAHRQSARQRRTDRASPSLLAQRLQASLGLSPSTTALNLVGLILHSTASILCLVFLNSTTPALVVQLGYDKDAVGSLAGTLVLADELLAIFAALLWGAISDRAGTRIVAVSGYILMALALAIFAAAKRPWPDLLLARLVFSSGASAVTAMLTGILTSYSAVPSKPTQQPEQAAGADAAQETTQPGDSSPSAPAKSRSGRLAAIAGLSTGLGALLAVFFLLRLPLWFAKRLGANPPEASTSRFVSALKHGRHGDHSLDPEIRQGLRLAYLTVAGISLLIALALFASLKPASIELSERKKDVEPLESPEETSPRAVTTALPSGSDRASRRARLRGRMARRDSEARGSIASRALGSVAEITKETWVGFALVGRRGGGGAQLGLAYLAGGLARALTIGTTVFVPLLVTHFFTSSGLCSDLPSDDLPPSEIKERCRAAFTVTSILSGVIQLVALLLAPVIGFLSDAFSPAVVLLGFGALGTASLLLLGLGLPIDPASGLGDPRKPIAFLAATGIGAAQIAAIVASLALCAQIKARVGAKAGAVAGAYSASGGLSILFIGKLGGLLFDVWTPSPFVLLAALAAVVATWSAAVTVQARRAASEGSRA